MKSNWNQFVDDIIALIRYVSENKADFSIVTEWTKIKQKVLISIKPERRLPKSTFRICTRITCVDSGWLCDDCRLCTVKCKRPNWVQRFFAILSHSLKRCATAAWSTWNWTQSKCRHGWKVNVLWKCSLVYGLWHLLIPMTRTQWTRLASHSKNGRQLKFIHHKKWMKAFRPGCRINLLPVDSIFFEYAYLRFNGNDCPLCKTGIYRRKKYNGRDSMNDFPFSLYFFCKKEILWPFLIEIKKKLGHIKKCSYDREH